MKLHRIEAVLFDMDETLLENTRSFQDIAFELYAHHSAVLDSVPADEFWEVLWSKAVDMWSMMFDGVLPGDDARLYTFVNTLRALELDTGLAPALLETCDEFIVRATRLYDDTLPVLSQLRRAGVRLGIVTNGYTTMQRKKAGRHRLPEHVDFLLVSEEVGAHKPDTAIFRAALDRARVAPRAAVFVGDMPLNDIDGAHAAGIHAVLYDYHGQRQHETCAAAHRIQRLRELLPLLDVGGAA
jgi:putative hydrolase of the HAD superfamily